MGALLTPWHASAGWPDTYSIIRRQFARAARPALLGLLLLGPCVRPWAAPAPPRAPDLATEVDGAATALLKSTAGPGVSVAVVRDGRIVLARAYGAARIDPPVPATATMRYAIGSVSKQFTAAAILLLAEDGRVSLEDPVARFFPALTRAADIRIRDLLSHTSGYRDYWPQDYVPPFMRAPIAPARLMQDWAGAPLDFEPRSEWQYSNTGYVVAAAIVEKITGEPLMQVLGERIFGPLAMRSVIDVNLGELAPGDAVGYTRVALGPFRRAPREGAGWLYGAAELAMTAEDLARWDIALMDGTILSARSLRAMTEATPLANGASTQYGLGLEIRMLSGHRVLAHGGEVSGFISRNVVLPEDRAAIVVLSNSDAGDAAAKLAERIRELLLVELSPASARQLERARRLFAHLQRGELDRELLTDDAIAYFDARALADCRQSLGGLGSPRGFSQVAEQVRGGMRLRVFAAHFAHRDLEIVARELPDGRFEQFQIE